MVDPQTVCCMCGDVGFAEKLFRCNCDRFQHSYCSNYYDETSVTGGSCDWCLSEEKSSTSTAAKHGGVISVTSRKSSNAKEIGAANRSTDQYSGDYKIKQNRDHHHRSQRDQESSDSSKGKNTSGTPSPKPTGRRYKFLKDVMC